MANVSVTTACNRSCPYCFARDAEDRRRSGDAHMSLATFGKALDFLECSGVSQARLLGGEPTMHPEFGALIHTAVHRGFDLLIFSNGLMSEDALHALDKIPDGRIRLLINMTDANPAKMNPDERYEKVFKRLGGRIMLGVNIYRPAADFLFLLDTIGKYGLMDSVRLGLAHPGLNRMNQYLHPRHYGAAGDKIAVFARQARKVNIRPELDCGFVPCMFSEEDLAALGDAAEAVGCRCNPVPDILPDGRIVPCYPLASLGDAQLDQSHSARAVRETFERRMGLYRHIGVYRECSSCVFFMEGRCNGGCLSAAMGRLQNPSARLVMPGHKGMMERNSCVSLQ